MQNLRHPLFVFPRDYVGEVDLSSAKLCHGQQFHLHAYRLYGLSDNLCKFIK